MQPESREDSELSALLEELCGVLPHGPGRTALRRSLQEVRVAWPGTVAERWMKWTLEAGKCLNLLARSVTGTPAALVEALEHEAILVCYDAQSARPLGLHGSDAGYTVLTGDVLHPARTLNREQLLQFLETRTAQGQLEGVVLQSVAAGAVGNIRHAGTWECLKQLLQPESSDIGIVLVFALVTGLLSLATPIAVESLVNTVAFGRLLQPIVILSAIVLAFLGFGAALRVLQTCTVEVIQQRLFVRIAAQFAWHLPRMRVATAGEHPGSELASRFLEIVTIQKSTAQLLLDGITLVLGTAIGMAVLAFYHPWLLALDLVLLALMGMLLTIPARGAIRTSIYESKLKYKVADWFAEIVRCGVTFRQGGGTQWALERADQLAGDYLLARREHFRILIRQIGLALGLQAVAGTAVLSLGGWLVVAGQLTLGQLVASELIVTAIVGSFAKMGKHLESFYDLVAAVDKLGTVLELPEEPQASLLCPLTPTPAAVRVVGASYHYDAAETGLAETSLTVAAGARVALLGPAGCGKSTLLDLLFGLRHPQAGYVTIDGIDTREIRPDILRTRAALVRDAEIVQGTLEENVHLNRTESGSLDAREALRQVGLLDTALRLPHSLGTVLTRDGRPLTDSQRQRLLLARAIVARQGLLLIDGVLDTLPDQMAADLLNFLCDRTQPWTLILVTGRPGLAALCDRTVTLPGGPGNPSASDPPVPEVATDLQPAAATALRYAPQGGRNGFSRNWKTHRSHN